MKKRSDPWTRLLAQLGRLPRSRHTPPIGTPGPRSLRLEQLAPRHIRHMLAGDLLTLAPSLWQNPLDPLDANGDGQLTALDALVVANPLQIRGPGTLETVALKGVAPQAAGPGGDGVLYVDTNGDGQLTAEDFDAVASYLNAAETRGVSNPSSAATGSEHLAEEASGEGAKDGSGEAEFSMMSAYGGSGSGSGSASGCGCGSGSGSGGGDPTNTPPLANDDDYYTLHDTSISEAAPGVMGNDWDDDGDPITAVLITGPTHNDPDGPPSFDLSADGSFYYRPKPDWAGQDEFTYYVTDGIDDSPPATVHLYVDNTPPVAQPIEAVVHWAQDPSYQELSLWDVFYDPDDTDEQLTYTVPMNTHPSVLSTSIDTTTGLLRLTFSGTTGISDLTIRATDRPGAYAEETFRVYVVDVVDYTVEARSWGEDWRDANGQVLWSVDEHRWTAIYEPVEAFGDSRWRNKPWEFRDDEWYPYNAFAWGSLDAPVFTGEAIPGPGDWAISPGVQFGPLFVQMTAPIRQPQLYISAVEWQPVDPETNFARLGEGQEPVPDGQRIFPERNHPAGEIRNRVNVVVTVEPALPLGYSDTIFVKVFDPDYYQDGGPAGTPLDGDPNDHEPTSHKPNDNFGGTAGGDRGMSPAQTSISLVAEETTSTVQMTITKPQPGNNFITAVHHRDKGVLNNYRFDDNGRTLYLMHQGNRRDVPDEFQTQLLTVWRTLWMELNAMVAPDDVNPAPPLPPIGLTQTSLQAALIEVRPLPAEYNRTDAMPDDDTGTLPFRRNLEMQGAAKFLNQVRDEDSERYFWVVHVVGAYQGPESLNYPSDTGRVLLGYAFLKMTDGPIAVYFETIRRVAANYPGAVDEQVIRERLVLHEVLHRFLGPHGAPGADEGVMNIEPTVLTGTALENQLTPRQIRLMHEQRYPGTTRR